MKLSIIERTESYRGDHGADVAIVDDYIKDETIEELINRCLSRKGRSVNSEGQYVDWIEIRLIKPDKGGEAK